MSDFGANCGKTTPNRSIRIDKEDRRYFLWLGEQMDYDLGIAVLVQQSHRPRRVSAETSGNV